MEYLKEISRGTQPWADLHNENMQSANANFKEIDSQLDKRVNKSGDTMLGSLDLNALPLILDSFGRVSGSPGNARTLLSSNMYLDVADARFKFATDNSIVKARGLLLSGFADEFKYAKYDGAAVKDQVFDPILHDIWHAGNLPVESGIWTPYFYGGTTPGEFIYNSSFHKGVYTRIGNFVHVYFLLSIKEIISPAVGALFIGGLPFPTVTPGAASPAYGGKIPLLFSSQQLGLSFGNNAIYCRGIGLDNDISANVDASQLKIDTYLEASGSYGV